MRALIEAELDFSEEEDIPEEISKEGFAQVLALKDEIKTHLDDNRAGEIIRDGFKIALMGKPNAGKSSLLNALAKRDVAIVTNEAGTTRDVLDIHLDIDGYAVIVSDTAGLRDSDKEQLLLEIKKQIKAKLGNHNGFLISRLRHREALTDCLQHLTFVIDNQVSDIELKAETLRHASDCIGRITGKIDVEDLLDVIFSEFCVGK